MQPETRNSLPSESSVTPAPEQLAIPERENGQESSHTSKQPDGGACPPNPITPAARVKNALRILGPGLVTGSSDDDPSGIAAYSQVGAQFGYTMLWTMVVSYPLNLRPAGNARFLRDESQAGLHRRCRRNRVLASSSNRRSRICEEENRNESEATIACR